METISIPRYSTIGKIEDTFNDYFEKKSISEDLLIDLSGVNFIELTSMLFLSQVVTSRFIMGFNTMLTLPKTEQTLMMLYTWRFFQIILELTNTDDISVFVKDSHIIKSLELKYKGNYYGKDLHNDYFRNYYTEEGIKLLVNKGFFSFVCLPFKSNADKLSVLRSQRLKWSQDLISAVLERNLFNNVEVGNILANTVIYECITNAARHPNADHLVIGSFFDKKKKSKKEGTEAFFTISIWDDGNSIIKTIKNNIDNNIQVRNDKSFNLAVELGLTSCMLIEYDALKPINNVMKYDYIPDQNSQDYEVLLSSFLPGISCNTKRDGLLYNDNDKNQNEELEAFLNDTIGPGLGLTFLLHAITSKLNGSVSVRTSEYFINIKDSGNKRKKNVNTNIEYNVASLFSVKIVKSNYNFQGNMITLRIPLKMI